tara:strand:+ start:392 stop:1147 length:756 start_codon:yes stop_codon:yes gene_type:complete
MSRPKQKVVFFGCSYSLDLPTTLIKGYPPNGRRIDDEIDFQPRAFAQGGSSNDNIINRVYEYVNSEEYKPTDILNIQYSYTNRLWLPSRLKGAETSFHGLNGSAITKMNGARYEKMLLQFYENFMVLFYDNKLYFENLLMKVDMLRSYLDSKNVKYVHFLHSTNSHYVETINNNGLLSDRHKEDEVSWNTPIKFEVDDLKKYNLIDFDNFVCMEDWSISNDYIISKANLHLPQEKCYHVIDVLKPHWKKII